jgi:hypothetical protein
MATDWAKLRRIMYQPSAVWLVRSNDGRRYLTDQFVLYDVDHMEEFAELEDGAYQLTVSEGPRARDSVPEPDIEAYFEKVFGKTWHVTVPSEWSVAEHPGKAMLWTYDDGSPGAVDSLPCLVGESTWTELKRYHPEILAEYTSEGNIFRFKEARHAPDCDPDVCDCLPIIFAYAAGIRVPDGQGAVAHAIARAA